MLLGYPQALSGQLNQLSKFHDMQTEAFFPEANTDQPWADATVVKRYALTFPMFPFRTLSPRELYLARQSSSAGNGETSSPMFPAHTQWDMTFKRRDISTLLNLMMVQKLNANFGTSISALATTERNRVLEFGGAGLVPVIPHTIVGVKITLKDVYLQVFIHAYTLVHTPWCTLSTFQTSVLLVS